ncbi:MAG: Flagellar biosynthetic protein FlhB [Deltaproteobacteria bacterium ADurb.Bin510]|jgi:flagellar biosynthesis protein|nr:MAG: Flagellar biosynthetic protein FlhB [Deltaproteobacteria bacterium ADurb.Bin510]
MNENKPRQAVALKYKRGVDAAPKVAAKGRGATAEKIIELARKHNVPIQRDQALLNALYVLELNETIPEELYKAVAEVLAFVYRMNGLRR